MTIRVSRRGGKEQIAKQAYHQVRKLPHTTRAKPELQEIKTRKDRRSNINASFYFVIPAAPGHGHIHKPQPKETAGVRGSPML